MFEEKILQTKLREMDMDELGAQSASLSLEDLARQISETKAKARAEKEAKKPRQPYMPPGGWKKKEDHVPLRLKPDPIEKGRRMVTIDKYRTLRTPRVWDSAMTVSSDLEKTLYRKGGGDTSGKRIFNLGRDAYPKDIPAQWKPSPCDKDFGTPSLELVTESFRGMLVKHVQEVPLRVTRELQALPESTTNDRNIKSRMAADLSKTRLAESEVLSEFARLDQLEVAKKGADAMHWDFSLKRAVPSVTMRRKYSTTENKTPPVRTIEENAAEEVAGDEGKDEGESGNVKPSDEDKAAD